MKKMSKKELAAFMKEKLSKTKITETETNKQEYFMVGNGEIKKQNNFAKKKTDNSDSHSIYKPNLNKTPATKAKIPKAPI